MSAPSALIPPPCGLQNVGNSCFLNSLLQALISLWRFIQVLPMFRDNALAQKILALVQQMQMARNGYMLHPGDVYGRLVGSASSPFLRRGLEEDAEECFHYLFDSLTMSDGRNESVAKYNKSVVQSLIGMRYKIILNCTICGKVRPTDMFEEPQFWVDIPETCPSGESARELPIDTNEKVINYIKSHYSYPDDYKCENCGAKNSLKDGLFPIRIERQLVRAGYGMVLINKKYFAKRVQPFPQSFILEGNAGAVYTFNVVAKIEHSGTRASGHYYTHCKRVRNDMMSDEMLATKRELLAVENNIRDHKISAQDGLVRSKELVEQLRNMDNESLLSAYLANDGCISALADGMVPTPNTYMIFYSRAE